MEKQAVFGGGCFWCTEAVFQMLKGVSKVESGYAGGTTDNPSSEAVSSGDTGHAEVIRVTYDPSVISYEDLLTVFFGSHDPTTPNRQGNDVGEQYRSVIFYESDEEKAVAEKIIKEVDDSLKDGTRRYAGCSASEFLSGRVVPQKLLQRKQICALLPAHYRAED